MTILPPFPGFDGLMTLSRREGVDIRPTLLRVLTDLYVQTPAHTVDEERQYVELASRLIDEVDDATRAAVRARLSIYQKTPLEIAKKLALQPFNLSPTDRQLESLQESEHRTPDNSHSAEASLIQSDAIELSDMFFAADANERRLILRKLDKAPLSAAASVDTRFAQHAVSTLEHTALEADLIGFTAELARALTLPNRLAQLIVEDEGGELLACAAKALDMPTDSFERVLLFLDPELGASVTRVYTLSRLYDTLSDRAALIMLAAWRGVVTAAPRARHYPMLHDDERPRGRPNAMQSRTDVRSSNTTTRRTSQS
jgi:hypothetical protein